jgi:fucose permease
MKTYAHLVYIVFLVFFVISFITNILGAIIPVVNDDFELNGFTTGLLPFSFFIAYGLMSIPSGILVEKYGDQRCMLGAWMLSFLGSSIFVLFPTYPVFLFSLFLIGTAMAMLQVVINPLLRISGGESNFAFYSVVAQLIFGGASFISPLFYRYLDGHLADSGDSKSWLMKFLMYAIADSFSWVSLYLLFSLISLVMMVWVSIISFPASERQVDEKMGDKSAYFFLIRSPLIWMYTIAMLFYVGLEQGIANWISEFLRTYHQLDPALEGAATVSKFWGFMTLGCLVGLGLLKIMDSKLVLRIFTVSGILVLGLTLGGSVKMALWGFPLLGFCLSVMYSIIISLALNSVTENHGSFTGILCSAIAGGALFSLAIGLMKDLIGLKEGMYLLFLALGYLLFISFWANPIITNRRGLSASAGSSSKSLRE